ncbi:amidohydrolase family protein [Flavobacterium sp. 90]|uniref:amidohydrolase family protein n=1 Tax=unclassified Flavobacterium TaxID=196869 RepID=UPI000EAEB154|nr:MULTISPECIES: amidohydrolase family protein [unclassified Flavobacterium]RKR05750.1 amidohydrolase family protein [Flavobacterium sp. 81]TCK57061.1 amidohydrolase family protein [Flavobacterium sp. 90]
MKDTYKNAHTHIFTMNNAPKDFLKLYLPAFLAKPVDNFTNTDLGAWIVKSIAGSDIVKAKRYATFLQIGKSKDQAAVFENLMSRYPNETFEFVTLCQNLEYLGVGRSVSGFEGQIEEVIQIKRTYPTSILPFFGLDPRWKGSEDEIQKTVERYFETKIEVGGTYVYPFQGLKIYPSTGHYAFDKKLKKTFEWAAANGVPVMTHTYYMGGIYNFSKNYIVNNLNPIDPYTGKVYDKPEFINEKGTFRNRLLGLVERENCKKTCSYFLEPHSYETMLEKIENLKICFAHFGGVPQIKEATDPNKENKYAKPYGVLDENWFNQIQRLMTKYSNVYTDISYSVAECLEKENNELYKTFFEEASKSYGKQILFGTDYFMTETNSLEEDAVKGFRNYATKAMISEKKSLWDKMARDNINKYLKSKYYP